MEEQGVNATLTANARFSLLGTRIMGQGTGANARFRNIMISFFANMIILIANVS